MIIDVTESSLASIRNHALRAYAEQYVHIYQDFMAQIGQLGVAIADLDDSHEVRARLAALREKAAVVCNDAKSVFVNRISPSCEACRTAADSRTFFVSLECHRNCFFCFNPNQQEYQYYRNHTRDNADQLDALRAAGQPVGHLALTGGEPLLHKAETIRFFRHARQNFPQAYTRLYTCGDHLERQTLQAFKDAGMNEIRFSIRLDDARSARRHTFKQIALAREYIPNVMVEMPVLPGSLLEMQDILLELDRLGVFGINLLEFCFPLNNPQAYAERNYRIKARPFRILYAYCYAGGLPIAGSETACLELIDFALASGLKLGVHYCSLENKFTGQIHQQNADKIVPRRLHFSERDYYLKSAKVFGEDVATVREVLDRLGDRDYCVNDQYRCLEFHVNRIHDLRQLDIDIGLSSNVIETRDGEQVIRELKVDVTTPQTFEFSQDL